MKNEIILIGGGGHCLSCIDVIEVEGKYKIAGIIDLPENIGKKVLDYPVIGSDDMIETLSHSYKYFFITIGQIGISIKRIELYNRLIQLNITMPTIISPFAYVSKYAQINNGTIVMHHALINASVIIGKNCIINNKALIEHNVIIGDHCHISTAAIINGGVIIDNESFVGSGAVTKQYIHLPKGSFIKANSIVK